MFDPPPGFADFLGDGELAVPLELFRDVDVPKVGVVHARRPGPGAAPILAMSVHNELDNQTCRDYLIRFLLAHLGEEELQRICAVIITKGQTMPDDAVERIGQAIATWGTGRQYMAVANLAWLTAKHWRDIRTKLAFSGIKDPMSMPTMHALLDATECAVLEAMDGKTAQEMALKRGQFRDQLYAPQLEVTVGDDGVEVIEPPPGWSPKEVEANNNAFAEYAKTAAH